MACNLTLADVGFDCTDLGIGGLKAVYLANRDELITGDAQGNPFVSVSSGAVTVTPDANSPDAPNNTLYSDGDAVKVEFNLKDGFSVFTDVKTVSADGIVSTVPTIAIEIPKMSPDHRDALNDMAKAGAELVAFVETAAGTYHMIGFDYGLYAATVDGTSGTGRAEKNRYQLTLTGDEDSLAYHLDASNWAKVAG